MTKTLVIGLDGVPYELLEMWKKNIDSDFTESFTKGVLKSTIPSQTSVALPALFTGKNPGKTGIFGFLDDENAIVRTDKIKHPKLWDILDENNIHSLFYNTRMISPLPKKSNCVFIDSGFLQNSKEILCEPANYRNLIESFPSEGSLIDWKVKENPSQKEFSEKVVDMIKDKYETFTDVFLKQEFDFIFYWIGETDLLHHYCWDNKQVIIDSYYNILNIVKKILDDFKDWNILIISDHGCERKPSINFYIDAWLASKGYLKMNYNTLIYSLIYFLARKFVPSDVRKKFVKSGQSSQEKRSNEYHGIDYKKSYSYYSTNWGIAINKNTEKRYEEIRHNLIKELDLVEFSGEKVFKEILRREEIYNGPYLEKMPDIVLRAKQDFELKPGPNLKIFGKAEEHNYGYIGSHNWARDGIFLAKGPDIRDDDFNLGELQIYDVMPTILHMYDTLMPNDFDGRVLREIFREGTGFSERKTRYYESKEKKLIANSVKTIKKKSNI